MPKHGIFVRPARLFDDYLWPGDGAVVPKRTVTPPDAKLTLPASPYKPMKRAGKAAAIQRRHPTLDKPAQRGHGAGGRKELRYYIDPRGRTMHTLKLVDPFGKPTLLLYEPRQPIVCYCNNHATDHGSNGCAAVTPVEPEPEPEPEPTPPSTEEPTKPQVCSISVGVGSEEPLPLDCRLPAGQMIVTVASLGSGDASSGTGTGTGTGTPAEPEPEPEPVSVGGEAHAAVERPGATGFSDDEDDDTDWNAALDASLDLQQLLGFSDDDTICNAALDASFDLQQLLADGAIDARRRLSTVKECEDLAKRLKRAAIREDWDLVRDMLLDEAAALVLEEDTLRDSGVGKVVGKLRQASSPAIAFAAEAVIDGWKFQLKIEPTDKTRAIGAKADETLAHLNCERSNQSPVSARSESPAAAGTSDSTTPGLEVSGGDGSTQKTVSSTARRRLEDSLGPLGLSITDQDLNDDTLADITPAPSFDAGKVFIGLSVLDQCEQIIEHMRQLVADENWAKLLELLRGPITELLVTEDDLRRSGIGRVVAKIVKRAPVPEVQVEAQTVVDGWKERIHHHDPVLERLDRADQKERTKFLEFMNLQPVPLAGAAGTLPEDGTDENTSGEARQGSRAVHSTKQRCEMHKSKKEKSLGVNLKLCTSPASGALAATVSDAIPDGLADRPGHEGYRIEEVDELIEMNGTRVANCSNTEVVKRLKESKLSLTQSRQNTAQLKPQVRGHPSQVWQHAAPLKPRIPLTTVAQVPNKKPEDASLHVETSDAGYKQLSPGGRVFYSKSDNPPLAHGGQEAAVSCIWRATLFFTHFPSPVLTPTPPCALAPTPLCTTQTDTGCLSKAADEPVVVAVLRCRVPCSQAFEGVP